MTATADTRTRLLDAAHTCLLDQGFAQLSTRRVADVAGVPLSQIHYHFRGKRGLVLAILEREDQRLLHRQHEMYGQGTPLWKRYEQACDFLDDDLRSGYVRVLQELIAAGWSDPEVARQVQDRLERWIDLLTEVATEMEQRGGTLGPFTARQIGTLIAVTFGGAEQMILLGDERRTREVRDSLRAIGALIRAAESSGSSADDDPT
jgi:AcrR family transcriptional regulator